MKMIRVRSLRTKILLIVFLFISIISAAFVLYSILTTVNYKQLRLEGIKKTVELETEKVNKAIAEMQRSAVYLTLEGILYYNTQAHDMDEISVREYLISFPAAIGGGFWFEPYAFRADTLRAGVYYYFDKEKNEVRLDDSFMMDEYDYHNQRWYREIKDGIKEPYQVVWTKPYIDDTGSFSLMTTAGAGVFNKNERLIGISTVDWEIEKVIEELTAIKPTLNSFVLLCVPEKDYIISSTQSNSSAGESLKSLPWDINSDSLTYKNVKYLCFSDYMDNGWLLSIYIPENEIFESFTKRNSRFSWLIAVSSILMISAAYFIISKYINEPIRRFTADVEQLAHGNLDMRIKVTTKDELGQFAEVINKMTEDLEQSIEENAKERAEKERINTELSVAKEIQASMLPCVFPPFPDRYEIDLYASMVPAREVGGDFYDFFFIDKDNLVVIIADVSGKGVPAALFMVIARTLIKNCSLCRRPKNVLESVNKKLCENNEAGMFVTAFLGFLNIPSGKFTFVNAGHNPPLVKKRGKSFEFLRAKPCIVLAWIEEAKYSEEEIFLDKGDVLFLYTDGVTEAMNNDKTLFSEQRLNDTLNKNIDASPVELLSVIKKEIDAFAEGAEQADDITMLALRINDQAQPVLEADDSENTMKQLDIEAKIENLDKVLAFINNEIEKSAYPDEIKNEICIATEEIFVNIANYSYAPDIGGVLISISTEGKTVIRFEDSGRPFNPLEHADPDLDTNLSNREIGGLGVYLVKRMMDTVEYSRRGNKNILQITKTPPK